MTFVTLIVIFTMITTTMAKRLVLWYRNDLRIHDNALLSSAINEVSKFDEVVCLYCFDPRHFKKTKYGNNKCDKYRTKFLIDSVSDLRRNLEDKGCKLIVAFERPEIIIPTIISSSLSSLVLVQKEITSEEKNVETKVLQNIQKFNSKLKLIDNDSRLYTVIPYKDMSSISDTFTPFKEKVEKLSKVENMLPTLQHGQLLNSISLSISDTCSDSYLPTLETLINVDDNTIDNNSNKGVMEFKGGESEGINRIKDWIWDGDNLKDYFDIRNGMLGQKYSSKFSPWLALGCVSPRYIYYEVKKYERERISNKSTYWLIFELIWRDFFRCLCAKYGTNIFKIGGAHSIIKTWSSNEEYTSRWKNGTTGYPLVDANMRELLHTGWMSNRGRQNVASFLIFDLGLDWRIGADWFESLLIDHDVCSNYGNWNAAAGLTGGRVNKFNISKQSRDYDAKGDYIRHWIPELKDVPAPLIFEPWKLSASDQGQFNVVIGRDYPHPINISISNDDRNNRNNGNSNRSNSSSSNRSNNSKSNNNNHNSSGDSQKRGRRDSKSASRVQHY